MDFNTMICFALLAMAVIICLVSLRSPSAHVFGNVCVGLLITVGLCNYYKLGTLIATVSTHMEERPPAIPAMDREFDTFITICLFLVTPLWTAVILLCGVYSRMPPTPLEAEACVVREKGSFLDCGKLIILAGWEPILLSWCLLLTNVGVLSTGLFAFLCSGSIDFLVPVFVCPLVVLLWCLAIFSMYLVTTSPTHATHSTTTGYNETRSDATLELGDGEDFDDSDTLCGQEIESDYSYGSTKAPDSIKRIDHAEQEISGGHAVQDGQVVRHEYVIRHEEVVREERVVRRDGNVGLWLTGNILALSLIGL